MDVKKIIVIGSTNMDMVVKTTHIPEPGETVLAGSFFMNSGGKGANQAVAAARIGGDVIFVTRLGNDVFGKQALQVFGEENIDTSYILSDPETPSGVALITVDQEGENSIVVASGANANLGPGDLDAVVGEINENTILLLQLEIPMTTVRSAVVTGRRKGACVVLNPAPMKELSHEVLKNINILTPNRKEAETLSGIKIKDIPTAIEAAKKIHELGVEKVVITMGDLGAVICENGESYEIPVPKVKTVDTTAAGDVFNGALCLALSEGRKLSSAVKFANSAAAISVTRLGAQTSIPYRNELSEHFLNT